MSTPKPPLPNTYYRLSVKAVIWRDGKLLLVREHGPRWVLPGGGLDHGEAPEVGLRRELTEELQIQGAITIAANPSYIGFGLTDHADSPFDGTQYCFVCYDTEVVGEIAPGPHTKELHWFTPAEVAETTLGHAEQVTIGDIIDHHEH